MDEATYKDFQDAVNMIKKQQVKDKNKNPIYKSHNKDGSPNKRFWKWIKKIGDNQDKMFGDLFKNKD